MSGPKRGSIAASIVAVVVGGAFGIVHVVGASAAGCSQNSVTLNVATALDIAPSVTAAADQWQRTDPAVNGRCIRVVVTAEPPAQTANLLVAGSGMTITNGALPTPSASDAVSPPDPAVWIPDSSVWLDRVRADVSEAFVAGTPPSLASSPVVLGIQHSQAATLKLTGGTITPEALKAALAPMRAYDNTFDPKYATPFQLGLAEPRNDATGLAGATALYQIDTQSSGSERDYSLVVADYRLASPEAEMATDAAGLISAFTTKNTSFKSHKTPQMSVAFLSEQAILAFDATNPPESLDAVSMDQDLAGLDYPIAVVAKVSTDVADAAALFRDEIRKPAYAGIFAAAGFRTADGAASAGFPAAHGALNRTIPVNPLHLTGTPNDPVAGALALWGAANTKSRVLVMLNEGASMAQSSVVPGLSRMKLAQDAATGGVGLFTDDSELGSWAFAPGLDGTKDYQEMVPVKALNLAGQVPALSAALESAQAKTAKSGCALYTALDAAYKYMLSTYEAGKINTIVVFTDCAEAAAAKSMQLADLTTDIGGRASASTPIPVILINVNPQAASINKNLNAIASVVGGKPLPLSSPQDIVNVFLQAIVALGPGS